jgi:hypothetical protein
VGAEERKKAARGWLGAALPDQVALRGGEKKKRRSGIRGRRQVVAGKKQGQ